MIDWVMDWFSSQSHYIQGKILWALFLCVLVAVVSAVFTALHPRALSIEQAIAEAAHRRNGQDSPD